MEEKSKAKGVSIAMILLAIVIGFGFVIGLTQTNGANNLKNETNSEISNYSFSDDGTLLAYTGNQTNVVIPETFSLSAKAEDVEMSSSSVYTLIDRARSLGIKNYSIEDQTGNQVDDFGNIYYQEKYVLKYQKRKVVEGTDYQVTAISPSAFMNNNNIQSVIIPNSVKTIGSQAFAGCTNLRDVNMPTSLERIENSAFYNCRVLQNLEFPTTLNYIGSQAFYNCDGLTSVTLPDGITEIYDMSFSQCDNLVSVTIPNSVRYIYSQAFYYCRNLVNLSLGNGIEFIANGAFYQCRSLTSVTIPSSCYRIEPQAFYMCNNLTKFIVESSQLYDIYPNSLNTNYVQNIYVPDDMYETYRSYGNWINYSQYIRRMSDLA